MSLIRPSMMALRVDDDARVAGGRRPFAIESGGRPNQADRLRGDQAGRLAWRRSARACRGPGTAIRPIRQPRSKWRRERVPRKPQQEPINSPSRSPTTRSRTRRSRAAGSGGISQTAGTTVRYGRIAKPTTIQANDHRDEQRAALGDSSKSRADAASASPTRPPRAARASGLLRITFPRVVPRAGEAHTPRGALKPP